MKKQLLVFLAILLAPLSLNAAIINVNYSGTVTTLGAWLTGDGVSIGDNVLGSFTYDSDLGTNDSVQAFSIAIGGGFTASMDGDESWFRVYNDAYTNPTDAFAVGTTATSTPLNGYEADVMQFGVFRYNSQGQLWDDELLPDLDDWANITLDDVNRADWHWMDFGASTSEDPHYVDQIRWDVQEFSYSGTAVPEPATIALLGLGLVAMGFFHTRRR